MYRIVFLFTALVLLVSSCKVDKPLPARDLSGIFKIDNTPYVLDIPSNFPEVDIPADNPLTKAKVALGKKLFYDKLLSVDYTISCNSCHKQEHAFADPRKLSIGVRNQKGTRNAPQLANIAYRKALFWDGRVATLEEQALHPIENPVEMDNTLDEVVRRLKADDIYVEMFGKAFGGPATAGRLGKAIASFERILISGNSLFNRNKDNLQVLSETVLHGYSLFGQEKKGDCTHCHVEPHFSDFEFRNTALYEIYDDGGVFDLTGLESDRGKFVTSTLHNIAVTAPFMHDGSMETLDEVLEHYTSGGQANSNRDVLMAKERILDPNERADLLAFLHSLTDSSFLTNPEFKP